MNWTRLPLAALSPSGRRARLSILIFHRVLPEPDPLFPGEVHARQFDQICGWLKSMFNVLALGQAVDHLRDGTLPSRAACITFDDGYADNHTQALPILQRHGLPATFYVATGFLDGGRMWNDTVIEAVRRAPGPTLDLSSLGQAGLTAYPLMDASSRRGAIDTILGAIKHLPMDRRLALTQSISDLAKVELPADLMMSSAQVRELHRAGMTIGGHTVRHPILATLDDSDARREIDEGRRSLQTIIGAPVDHFAYPNGKPRQDYAPVHVQIVRELGFRSAVSTAWGAARAGDDPLQLPRFTPWDRSAARFAYRLIANLAQR